jgi:hypothetical protein
LQQDVVRQVIAGNRHVFPDGAPASPQAWCCGFGPARDTPIRTQNLRLR